MNYGKDVQDFVKRWREESKYSQADVGRLLGYSCSQYVSNIERGIDKRPVSFCAKLMRHLDAKRKVHLEFLLKEALFGRVKKKCGKGA